MPIDPLDKDLRALRTLQCPQHVQPNDDRSGYRVSSGAFIAGTDGTISVDIEESMIRAGLAIGALYPSLPRAVGLVAHTVRQYESNGFSVSHDPVSGNHHHGSVRTVLKNSPARKAARALAQCAEFIVTVDPDVVAAIDPSLSLR